MFCIISEFLNLQVSTCAVYRAYPDSLFARTYNSQILAKTKVSRTCPKVALPVTLAVLCLHYMSSYLSQLESSYQDLQ